MLGWLRIPREDASGPQDWLRDVVAIRPKAGEPPAYAFLTSLGEGERC